MPSPPGPPMSSLWVTCELFHTMKRCCLLRDDLDENGGGDLDFEAAAGSGVMIVAGGLSR